MTAEELYAYCFSCPVTKSVVIAGSGSHRVYKRISGAEGTVIGVEGTDKDENDAFFYLAEHLRREGINVPNLIDVSPDAMTYLQEDLGDESLFAHRDDEEALMDAIRELPRIQFLGGRRMNWSVCYPQPGFDRRMIDFDLNYFKYCFLKLVGTEFNEVRLQDDFDRFADMLLEGMDDCDTFMYRDFQARNIILKDGKPWFIDFQGGRRGPIYYDLASFVWQAKAAYSWPLREKLVKTYLGALEEFMPGVDETEFKSRLKLFAIYRCLQVLGAYGFRGLYEGKQHFVESIPYALDNLSELLPVEGCTYLTKVLSKLCIEGEAGRFPRKDSPLEVDVWSFSYKKGIPSDESGNGGGYVFDCRYVNNPGRYEQYRSLTGRDKEVIDFLEGDGEISVFLKNVDNLVDAHVNRFIERGFTHLTVCFGCTGGHHRSVYSAEHVARRIADRFGVKVHLHHRELGIKEEL